MTFLREGAAGRKPLGGESVNVAPRDPGFLRCWLQTVKQRTGFGADFGISDFFHPIEGNGAPQTALSAWKFSSVPRVSHLHLDRICSGPHRLLCVFKAFKHSYLKV